MPTDPPPTDPWKCIQIYEDPQDGCPMVQWEEVQAALAAERQQATAQQEKDNRHEREAWLQVEELRAEVASLTQQLAEARRQIATLEGQQA